ncbi:hypothetical protein FM21_16195 [Streptomyces mutabilis]|uniref:Uncharacterized protein n=1 Tax=Streptomyces mutabilis TaxID=67332 RepID=A0A086MU90_9ACTN|nr:hypothetical protein FM21_16195 [Streptomyces mutabilis]
MQGRVRGPRIMILRRRSTCSARTEAQPRQPLQQRVDEQLGLYPGEDGARAVVVHVAEGRSRSGSIRSGSG